MKDITETLRSMISEFEQLVKDNSKLNEDLLALEKEKADGYKKFNTDTHILVERDTLEIIADDLGNAKYDAEEVRSSAEDAYSYADTASSNADSAVSNIRGVIEDVDALLKTDEETAEVE